MHSLPKIQFLSAEVKLYFVRVTKGLKFAMESNRLILKDSVLQLAQRSELHSKGATFGFRNICSCRSAADVRTVLSLGLELTSLPEKLSAFVCHISKPTEQPMYIY